MAKSSITISVTEMRPYRRLVDFLQDVDRYADENVDLELQDMVEDCRNDLRRIVAGDEDE